MPQEDDQTAEPEHGEEVGLVIFPTADQSAEIVKPCGQALDFPAGAAATQFAAVLGVFPVAIVFVRCVGCGVFAASGGCSSNRNQNSWGIRDPVRLAARLVASKR